MNHRGFRNADLCVIDCFGKVVDAMHQGLERKAEAAKQSDMYSEYEAITDKSEVRYIGAILMKVQQSLPKAKRDIVIDILANPHPLPEPHSLTFIRFAHLVPTLSS